MNYPGPPTGVIRSLLATVVSTGGAGVLSCAAATLLQVARGPGSTDAVVASGVVCVGAGAAAVLAAGCWLLFAGAVRHRLGHTSRWCDAVGARLTPAVLRRLLAVTVSTGLGITSLGGVAYASIDLGWDVTSESSPDRTEPSASARTTPRQDATDASGEVPDGGYRPDGPPAPPLQPPSDLSTDVPADPASDATAPAAATPSVTVAPGDCLWTIAAEHLGPGASDAEISAAWPRWYDGNRGVIGPDPDLIHPGQVLVAPDAPQER